jgi:hypothetical protein
LGIGDWAQSPIPNPQSPIPNPQNNQINLILSKNLIFKYLFLIHQLKLNKYKVSILINLNLI